jgi:hypothetical protein
MSMKGQVECRVSSVEIGVLKLRVCTLILYVQKSGDILHAEGRYRVSVVCPWKGFVLQAEDTH